MFGHSWIAAKVMLWGFFVATVGLTGFLAWRIYEAEEAVWTALLLTASSRALHGYVGTIQYEVVAGFLLVWLLLCANWAVGSGRKSRFLPPALLGFLTAVCILIREVFVVLAPVLALYVWLRARSYTGKSGAAMAGVAVFAGAALPVVVWAVFQSERAGRPVMISDKASTNWALGNNPKADGTFNNRLVGDPAEPSGLAFILERPVRFLHLVARRFLYFWGILHDTWNVARPSSVWIARATGGALPLEAILPLARGGWLLLLFIASLATFPRAKWQTWWILPGAVMAIMAVHLATISSYRFAIPTLPVVFAFGSSLIARLVNAAIRGVPSTWVGSTVAIGVLATTLLMQQGMWPISYSLQAAGLDGITAVDDRSTNQGVRFAGVEAGPRAVVILTDQYLPEGRFTLSVEMRVYPEHAAAGAPAARVRMFTLDGQSVCSSVVTVGELSTPSLRPAKLSCMMPTDAVATLLVETAALAPLQIGRIALRWND